MLDNNFSTTTGQLHSMSLNIFVMFYVASAMFYCFAVLLLLTVVLVT